MPPLILGFLELTALAWLSGALGRRLLHWLRVSITDVAERITLQTGLGLGALQFLPFLLFASGIGRPSVFRCALVLLAAVLWPDLNAVAYEVRLCVRNLSAPRWWHRALLAGLALLLAALYFRALAPPSYGDAVSYHLTASIRYLQAGRFRYLPTLTHTNWPLGAQMLFALLLALSPASPVAIVSYLFGLVTLGALTLLARRLAGASACVAAIGLFLLVDGFSYEGFWHQMTLAMSDVGLTAFATLAVFTLHCAAIDRRREADWGQLSALFTGLAATMKLSGLWVLVAFTFVYGLVLRRQGRHDFVWRALRYGSLAGCVVAPWYIRTWVLTGNPFYPMFSTVLGGIEWSAEGWDRFQRGMMLYNSVPGLPPTPTVLRITHACYALLGLLAAILILRATRRSIFAVPAAAAAAFLACICLGNYFHTRFLMPILPATMACLATVWRGKERHIVPALCTLTAALALFVSCRANDPTLPQALQVAVGRVSREDYLRTQMADYALTEFANRHLPEQACILIGTFEYNLAYYRAETLWPDYWLQDSLHYDSPDRLESDLRRLGVTHLVLKTDFPGYCAHSYYCRQRLATEPAAFSALVQRHGTKLFEANGHALYALDLNAGRRKLVVVPLQSAADQRQ